MNQAIATLALSIAALLGTFNRAEGQSDTAPRWQARYGGGPSFGSPDSNFDGSHPPAQWCLPTNRWGQATIGWLHRVLSDTTDFGDGWRMVLGNAPRLLDTDTLSVMANEYLCRRAAAVVNREVLGWSVGPPPMFVVRVRTGFVAYPSNAQLGEFGQAVALDSALHVLGVATW